MKIVGISGSRSPNSRTSLAVQLALDSIATQGWETEFVDLCVYNLPFCDGQSKYPDYPDLERMRQVVRSAHGIILGTPEYHGTLSGVLKNALDLLDSSHVKDCVFAVIAVCGGGASPLAISTIYTICRYLKALVIPEQLIIPHSEQAFDEKGVLVDPEVEERLHHLTKSLLTFTKNNHPAL